MSTEIEQKIDAAMASKQFDGVKVFSATKARERSRLGEDITFWMKSNPGIEVSEKIVTQSSDSEFHCLTITLFYREADGSQQVRG